MSAHDWPEFDDISNDFMERLSERDFYNYAKVRIDACAGADDRQVEGIANTGGISACADNWQKAIEGYKQQRDALQQRCEELVDIAHECQKIIKELCACYSHHEPIATLERIEAIKQVQP